MCAGKHMRSTVGRRFKNWSINVPQPCTLIKILYNLKNPIRRFMSVKTRHIIHWLMANVHGDSIAYLTAAYVRKLCSYRNVVWIPELCL
jgi:hypothetical protein